MDMHNERHARRSKKPLLLLIAGLCLFILVLAALWVDLGDFVKLNQRVVVGNQGQTIAFLKRNTPIRFELVDEGWGTAIVDAPEELYSIWSVLETLEPMSGSISQRDHIKGKIHFFDGDVKEFAISNQFQLGDFVLGNRDDEMKVTDLFQILLHTLHSRDNLVNLMQNSDRIYLKKASIPFVPDDPEVLGLSAFWEANLIDEVLQSERVMDSKDLNLFLRQHGNNPLYHIFLVRDDEPVAKYVVISVLSEDFYSVVDFSYLDRNILYFRGNMKEFADRTFRAYESVKEEIL